MVPFAISAVGAAQQWGGPALGTPCLAVWPAIGGQSSFPVGCAGHDEPSMSFYSVSPASGGNVTWNVTLPTDRSPTANQSDLYAAAWFGLVVSDPAAWLGQCYIEVQLYPDFAWSSPGTSVAGTWSGAVVGWQVDPGSGVADTCFYSPLYLDGTSSQGFFSMAQGDALSLHLVGWAGNPVGENISLRDRTSGGSTYITLYNSTGRFPLDPAYATDAFQNALAWGAGGQSPISFAFEIGRSGNPGGVRNNTWGGCNPGPGLPSPADHAVPCPSYDPASWINDTLTPWVIGVPTFFTAASQSRPAQVGFSSTLGALGAVAARSGDTCLDRLGSASCSYPWFGYSCSDTGFNFGATDYAQESDDFRQSAEYPGAPGVSVLGLPEYGQSNVSVPSCAGSNYTVAVGLAGVPGGTVHLLSQSISSARGLAGIEPGAYSLSAHTPIPGAFGGWSTSGHVSVDSSTSASTTLRVSGDGTVTATFSASGSPSRVWCNSTTSGSAVTISPGPLYENGTPVRTLSAGQSTLLPSGVYGLQADPPPGTKFVGWSVLGGSKGATLASPRSPLTWLTVTGATSTVTIEATYAGAVGAATVKLEGNGDGVVSLAGVAFPYNSTRGSSNGTLTLAPGTYSAIASPAPGWSFLGWSFAPAAALIDFSPSTKVPLLAGVAQLKATFAANLTTSDAPGGGGRVALNGIGPLLNDTTTALARGVYPLDALPFGHFSFKRWTVTDPTALWVLQPGYPLTRVQVNGTGGITATFQSAPTVSLTFVNSPAAGGSISFDFQTISGGSTTNTTLAVGPYLIGALPAAGYALSSWTVTDPPLTLTSGILNVNGGGGVLTAHFVVVGYPVLFVAGPSVDLTSVLNGQTLASGSTLPLPSGTYSLTVHAGTGTTFVRWVPSGKLTVASRSSGTTHLTVTGPGTLFAVAYPFALAGLTALPSVIDVGVPTTLSEQLKGTEPVSFQWTGLPAGCPTADQNPLHCTALAAGTFRVQLTATDAAGDSLNQSTFLQVNGLPTVSLSVSPNPVLDGANVVLTANVSGGTGPFTYTYSGLPGGCASVNSSSFACAPNETGTFQVTVTARDAYGFSTSAPTTLSVGVGSTSFLNGIPRWFWGVIVAAVGLDLVALVVYWRRRVRARSPPGPTP